MLPTAPRRSASSRGWQMSAGCLCGRGSGTVRPDTLAGDARLARWNRPLDSGRSSSARGRIGADGATMAPCTRASGGDPEDPRRAAAAGHPQGASGEADSTPSLRCRTETHGTAEKGEGGPATQDAARAERGPGTGATRNAVQAPWNVERQTPSPRSVPAHVRRSVRRCESRSECRSTGRPGGPAGRGPGNRDGAGAGRPDPGSGPARPGGALRRPPTASTPRGGLRRCGASPSPRASPPGPEGEFPSAAAPRGIHFSQASFHY